jgi:acyl-CoA hydrolase
MVKLLAADKIRFASATAFSLSPNAAHALKHAQVPPQDREEISNHPEPIRRLGCIAMNGLIEADIYGNVNSTHVMGSCIQNGIGGSGDFARNAYVSIRPVAQAAGESDHRELRAPRLQAGARRLFPPRQGRFLRPHAPSRLDEASSWHRQFVKTGAMAQ